MITQELGLWRRELEQVKIVVTCVKSCKSRMTEKILCTQKHTSTLKWKLCTNREYTVAIMNTRKKLNNIQINKVKAIL